MQSSETWYGRLVWFIIYSYILEASPAELYAGPCAKANPLTPASLDLWSTAMENIRLYWNDNLLHVYLPPSSHSHSGTSMILTEGELSWVPCRVCVCVTDNARQFNHTSLPSPLELSTRVSLDRIINKSVNTADWKPLHRCLQEPDLTGWDYVSFLSFSSCFLIHSRHF